MATYQEQIAQHAAERRRKVMVSLAELGALNKALMILERDKIIDAEARICFLKAYTIEHPEINEAFIEQRSPASDGPTKAQAE